jgi:hypothetical protein
MRTRNMPQRAIVRTCSIALGALCAVSLVDNAAHAQVTEQIEADNGNAELFIGMNWDGESVVNRYILIGNNALGSDDVNLVARFQTLVPTGPQIANFAFQFPDCQATFSLFGSADGSMVGSALLPPSEFPADKNLNCVGNIDLTVQAGLTLDMLDCENIQTVIPAWTLRTDVGDIIADTAVTLDATRCPIAANPVDRIFDDGFSGPTSTVVATTARFVPALIEAGATSTMTLRLTNSLPDPVTLSADMTQTLPDGLTVADTTNPTTTCAGATLALQAGATRVTIPRDTSIPGSGSCVVVFDVGGAGGTYTNTVPAGTMNVYVDAAHTQVATSSTATSAALTVNDGTITDPSFEATTGSGGSNPDWESSDPLGGGTVFFSGADNGALIPTRTGSYAAWFGGYNPSEPEVQSFSQTVEIGNDGPKFLNYWRFTYMAPVGATTLAISVDDNVVSTVDLVASGYDFDYVRHSADLTPFADGATHTIKFEFDSDGTDSDGDVFIDDVTIENEGVTEPVFANRMSSSVVPVSTSTSRPSFHH